MRDSIRLNSWDSFLVILPSISSETCVMYSSCRERLRARYVEHTCRECLRARCVEHTCSCVSLVTAANFRLFLNVAIFEGKMLRSYED